MGRFNLLSEQNDLLGGQIPTNLLFTSLSGTVGSSAVYIIFLLGDQIRGVKWNFCHGAGGWSLFELFSRLTFIFF